MAALRPIVVVIARNSDGKFLLHMRDNCTPYNPLRWALCGGSVEAGELAVEAAAREFEEEYGTRFAPGDFRLLGTDVIREGWSVFLLEAAIGWPPHCGEGAGFGFFTSEEIAILESRDTVATWLCQCLNCLTSET